MVLPCGQAWDDGVARHAVYVRHEQQLLGQQLVQRMLQRQQDHHNLRQASHILTGKQYWTIEPGSLAHSELTAFFRLECLIRLPATDQKPFLEEFATCQFLLRSLLTSCLSLRWISNVEIKIISQEYLHRGGFYGFSKVDNFIKSRHSHGNCRSYTSQVECI